MATGSLHHGRFIARVHNGHRNPSMIFRSNPPTLAQAWATALALVLAALSWFLVERPALHLKHRFGTRTPAASPAT